MMVISAVTSHAAMSRAGEPTVRPISAETMKMPEPIIEPMTMAVAEKSPMPRTKCGVAAGPVWSMMVCVAEVIVGVH